MRLKAFAVSQPISPIFDGLNWRCGNDQALERERENKLMNVDAITASIAHEVKQPLTAIATYASAALRFSERRHRITTNARGFKQGYKRQSPRERGIRQHSALFRKTDQAREPIDVSQIILEAVQSLSGELKDHGVTTHTELTSELPLSKARRGNCNRSLLT